MRMIVQFIIHMHVFDCCTQYLNRYAVHMMDRYVLAQRDYRTGCSTRLRQMVSRYCIFFGSRLYGNYLAFCYLIVKILYAVNAVGQLFLLDVFLGYDFHVLGIHVIRHLLFGTEWTQSDRYVCQFRIPLTLG
jgi:innexin